MPNETVLVTLDKLAYYDGKIKDWTGDELAKFSMVKLGTATEGYAASYELQFDGTKVGSTIDIPKDFMLQDAEIKTCTVADEPVAGYKVGDLYFDFTVNVTSGGSSTAKHIYLLVADAFAGYDPGNGITISSGVISAKIDTNAGLEFTGNTEGEKSIGVKTGDGIDIDSTTKAVKAKIGDGLQANSTSKATEVKTGDGIQINSSSKAVEAKLGYGLHFNSGAIQVLPGDGLTIDGSTQSVAARTGDGIKINSTSKGIEADIGDGLQTNTTSRATEVKTGDGIAIDSTSKAVKANVGTGLEINSTSKAIDLVAQSSAAGAPAVGGVSTADYASFKGAADTFSASAGSATAGTAVGNVTPYTKTVTVSSTDVGGTATADAFHFDVEWKEYGNATPTSGQTQAAAGLMSGSDKDYLDGLANVFGSDGVTIATESDIDALFD